MTRQSLLSKQQSIPRYKTRAYNRCNICGRPHSYMRKIGFCRICLRQAAHKDVIPGIQKASW